jgi:hypothetical protein
MDLRYGVGKTDRIATTWAPLCTVVNTPTLSNNFLLVVQIVILSLSQLGTANDCYNLVRR